MPKDRPIIGLPKRHPEPDSWKAHSLRQAARIRELEDAIRHVLRRGELGKQSSRRLRDAIDPRSGWVELDG